MTVLLARSFSEKLFPPHLLYAGKTTKCHQKFTFPVEWGVWHTDSYSIKTYIYSKNRKNSCSLLVTSFSSSFQNNLLQRCSTFLGRTPISSFLTELEKRNIIPVSVPVSCTEEIYPLD